MPLGLRAVLVQASEIVASPMDVANVVAGTVGANDVVVANT